MCVLLLRDFFLGTNDVGALKAAHVGISVINNAELESKLDKMHARVKKEEKKASGGAGGASKSKDRRMRAMLEQQSMDPTVVKFGDASIASPFTARRTSVDSVLTVLRQGRCTLVTTIQVRVRVMLWPLTFSLSVPLSLSCCLLIMYYVLQVYKILALNCLVSAYLMSSLYLLGLKQGDTQMTALGLITAGMFFAISQVRDKITLASLTEYNEEEEDSKQMSCALPCSHSMYLFNAGKTPAKVVCTVSRLQRIPGSCAVLHLGPVRHSLRLPFRCALSLSVRILSSCWCCSCCFC